MELDPVILSRIQFAFVISFHIIFPAFTIGLAAWLATIEGARLTTGNLLYRRIFDFWLKIFALSFGMGVVTGIVMAFQFATNWGVLAEKTGSIQGPLLGYESFTAFMLEATFFSVMMLGRKRVSPGFYFFACCMVTLGTMFSSFWILANNSWMQVPLGHTIVDGKIIPADWWTITTGPIMRVRWPHMLLAAFLTTGMCVAATGAWHLLRGIHRAEARVMLNWGLELVAVLIPVQLFFGHLTGLYVLKHQPAKFAAIEARWQSQQPASEVLIAIPDEAAKRNLFVIEVPKLGSIIASGNWTAREIGLDTFPPEDQPPVAIPFFAFRLMVGMGLIMLAVSWTGNLLRWRGRLQTSRWFLWITLLSFPTGFIAILTGWFTAEVGRQPWVVYGLLRTADAVTPSLTGAVALFSLLAHIVVYAVFLGAFYIPVLLMLLGLIFRGVAFEFRHRTDRMRWLWDSGFSAGSTIVAFVQGAAVGAMMRGIPVANGQYAGSAFGWLHPFPILTGIGLVLGYALLGAGWLTLKSEGALRDWAYARIPWLAAGVIAVLGLAFVVVMTVNAGAVAQSNLRERSWGLVFPILGVAALLCSVLGARARRDGVPFAMTALFFLSAYLTLGVMLWPYMIPYAITVANAAAPDASLQFLFYGVVVVLPVIVVYTIGVYWVFRGKVRRGYN